MTTNSSSNIPTGATGTVLTGNGVGTASTMQTPSGNGALVDQNSSTVTMAVNSTYVTDNGASLVTYTLPAAGTLGQFVEIVGASAGLWTIAQAAGQTIHFGNVNTTTGAGGSMSATNRYDCIKLRCTTANTDWTVVSSMGNITYV